MIRLLHASIHRPRGLTLLTVALLLCSSAAAAHAQSSADESGIRAAMLLNISRFIDWPAWKMGPDHPQFVVCILGSDPIAPYADHLLEHQSIATKQTAVKHVSATDNLSNCHLLYTSLADRKVLARMQPELNKNAVLTVSERSNTLSTDQIVGLPAVEDHVHIEINLNLAQRSSLQISSRLLRLATVTP